MADERETCSWCEKEMDAPYWENLLRAFCSLDCTNRYLKSEGFHPITGPGQSTTINWDDDGEDEDE